MRTVVLFIACMLFSIAQAVASEKCSDEIFLRRAYLTVTGALPSPSECVEFFEDSNPNKREVLIDRLIKSELGLKYMQMRWGDRLSIFYSPF